MDSRHRLAAAATLGTAACALVITTAPMHSTLAAFTDRSEVPGHVIAAAWTPDPPARCGDLSRYGTPPLHLDAVIWGTPGDDTLVSDPKGNHPQIIMGLEGDDVITGGNSGDCLVGGPGHDRLIGGNAKDILLGGAGNDFLDGGNAKDYLDGEDDADECEGGNGKDDVVNCDPPPAPAALVAPLTEPEGEAAADEPPALEQPEEPATKTAEEPATDSETTKEPDGSPEPAPAPEVAEEPAPVPATEEESAGSTPSDTGVGTCAPDEQCEVSP